MSGQTVGGMYGNTCEGHAGCLWRARTLRHCRPLALHPAWCCVFLTAHSLARPPTHLVMAPSYGQTPPNGLPAPPSPQPLPTRTHATARRRD
eukprot:365312-Chlamydomonas_euryale.AAC.9